VALVLLLLEGVAGFGYFALVHPAYWTGPFLPLALGFLRGSMIVLTPTYIVTALLGHLVHLQRRARQRELTEARLAAQLAQAQLAALRMQLHPHFLPNSLNAVAGLVREQETGRAVQALALLSDLLRDLLDGTRTDEVTVRAELAFIGRYLELERLRFSDRLRVEVEIGDDAWDA
jgi:LytS/YehU family sensor histidine kinase